MEENRQFIFCAHKSEDDNENIIPFPKEINLRNIIKNIPDTTDTMFAGNRYAEFSKEELIKYSERLKNQISIYY